MTDFYVVVDDPSDWQPYYPSQDVISFDDYLDKVGAAKKSRVRIINLCRSYRYLGTGYYCSLLGEARGHHVFPSAATINELHRKNLSLMDLDDAVKVLKKLPAGQAGDTLQFRCWFGQTQDPNYSRIAQIVFERYPCPILEVSLSFKIEWQVRQVKAISLKSLSNPEEQEAFANTFEQFSRKMWLKPKARKTYRYDLAILVDPEESIPPSNPKALKSFVKAGKQLGIDVDMITRRDFVRVSEYDGLFIRETTAVDHHTYRFAKRAEADDLVVIDDSTSILRCTNKIYLADLLKTHRIPTPVTVVLNQPDTKELEKLVEQIGLPIVLKIPDGSFSRGVIKADTFEQLQAGVKTLLKESALLLAQEFLYTDYDWRIGILNNKPLYACRYYMVQDHWQIYKHNANGAAKSGGFDSIPTFETPKAVLDVAVQSCKLIGNGLYGVDIKQSKDRVVVIEINDNPSIESGVEDGYLGEQLYVEIMGEFLRRMEARGRTKH
ncbi:MAG: RimK family protein [Gammaproteobacteria bacterium]|nr:RimK family protein [Gammaproteobacteria bacterium]MDH5800453.1 RimK family protein [Gammaproteobacteria bacterium]